jgi:ribulose kinase
MCAATGAGWFPSVAAAAGAMAGEIARETVPCADRQERYAELLEIYREIYPKLRRTYGRLARFAAKT